MAKAMGTERAVADGVHFQRHVELPEGGKGDM